jgi:release factor glutamine methyltransferase
MLLDPDDPVPEQALQTFEALARRRLKGEPAAYLLGKKEFYGLEFLVSADVLIPRPETEGIVDIVRENFSTDAAPLIVDIGTGSGVLAVTCAYFLPHAEVLAVDISRCALRVARSNAVRHGVGSRVFFVQADLIQACCLDHIDLMLANLPYVPETFRAAMSPEVVSYEPDLALFAGEDGLDCYRSLSAGLRQPKAGSMLLCEMDCSQGKGMREIFEPLAAKVEILPDATGRERIVSVVF